MKNLICNIIGILCFISLSGCEKNTEFHDEHVQTTVEVDKEGHEDHDGENHNDEVALKLSEREIEDAGIIIKTVSQSDFSNSLDLPAEIRFDANRVAHVHSRISGAVTQLKASEGDVVKQGQVLALIASRDLAGLKQDLFSTKAKEKLAKENWQREQALWQEKIVSRSDLQSAEAAYEVAKIERISAENKLVAAGLPKSMVKKLNVSKASTASELMIRAPISGIVVQRNTVLGDTVSAAEGNATRMFTIVDQSIVWADIAVYKKDIGSLKVGTPVSLYNDNNELVANTELALILPVIDEISRTATARAIVKNVDQLLIPGQFVRANIISSTSQKYITVQAKAVQKIGENNVVFVLDADGFEPRVVELGPINGDVQAIVAGLNATDQYVSEGSFVLKAELEKSSFGDGHAH